MQDDHDKAPRDLSRGVAAPPLPPLPCKRKRGTRAGAGGPDHGEYLLDGEDEEEKSGEVPEAIVAEDEVEEHEDA